MSRENFRDRLRKLRRDGQGSERDEGAPSEPVCASVTTGRSTGDPEGLESPDEGVTWARKTLFPITHRHGEFALEEVRGASSEDFVLLSGDESLAELDLWDSVYLDTETTGLSGGAGTYVFMVGLGSFRRDDAQGEVFEVWQGFLRGPAEEAALLAECSRRIEARSAMVSFFGKSFDRHRLEDKMRLCQVEPPFHGRLHLDLYHPCRRLYRSAYEDGRLKTLERELCGLQREDDLPGALAPEAWFDYLAGRPHQLEGVFRHNLEDVLSLVTLAAHLGRSQLETRLDRTRLAGDARSRAAGLARSFLARGERELGIRWIDHALDRGHPEARELRYRRAEALSRCGEVEGALTGWRELLAEPEDHLSCGALIELAKLLEHRLKDPRGALETVRVGLLVADKTLVGRAHASAVSDLEKRRARLEASLAQSERER